MEKPKRLHLAVLFAVAFATLCLELLFTRVLAFVFWNHIVYLIISLALLGYGMSSVFISVFHGRVRKLQPDLFLSANILLCAGSTIFALLCLSWLNGAGGPAQYLATMSAQSPALRPFFAALPLLAAYLLFLLPFFFGGNVLVYLFYSYPAFPGRLYSWDLAGAALGCLAFVPLIGGRGAVFSILAVLLPLCVLGAALAAADGGLGRASGKLLAALSLCALAATVFCLHSRARLFQLTPDRTKSLGAALDQRVNPGAAHEYSAWDVVSRLDITSSPGRLDIGWNKLSPGVKMVTFDGDAISQIAPHTAAYPLPSDIRNFAERDLHLPFFAGAAGGDHFIIGLGGGVDIDRSLLMQARTITGVEINSAVIRAMKTDHTGYNGGLFNRPQVAIYNSEGRSFLKRSGRKFDLIQLTGVDTYTAMNTGAYVLAENYLYTVEAFRDYYDHLSDDGVLCIHRWFYDVRPRESLRLFAIALEALRQEKVPHPELHIAVVKSGLGITFVRKKPFTPQEAAAIEKRLAGRSRVAENLGKPPEARDQKVPVIYFPGLKPDFSAPSLAPYAGASSYFYRLASAFTKGGEAAFYKSYEYDVAPVTDNRPFFFNYHKASTLARRLFLSAAQAEAESSNPGLVQGYWPYFVFLTILLAASAAAALFIFAPLLAFRREGLKTNGGGWLAAYFAALGAGFIMIEIVLMQKFALFLGHPMFSVSTVLGGMLLFAGLGSGVSGRWAGRPAAALRVCTGLTVVLIALLQALAPFVIGALLGSHLPVRAAATLLMVAPLAAALGTFFPLGLKLAGDRAPEFVPWAWGINSGFTVLGSVLAIILGMSLGFSAVLLLGAGIYVTGFFALRRYALKSGATF